MVKMTLKKHDTFSSEVIGEKTVKMAIFVIDNLLLIHHLPFTAN